MAENEKIVLIIEDEAGLRDVLSIMLPRITTGMRFVFAADNRDETIRAALGGAVPDAVVTDYNLGTKETGTEWINRMKRGKVEGIDMKTPVMVMSGDDSVAAARSAKAARVPFLGKPFDFKNFVEQIEKLLGAPGPEVAKVAKVSSPDANVPGAPAKS